MVLNQLKQASIAAQREMITKATQDLVVVGTDNAAVDANMPANRCERQAIIQTQMADIVPAKAACIKEKDDCQSSQGSGRKEKELVPHSLDPLPLILKDNAEEGGHPHPQVTYLSGEIAEEQVEDLELRDGIYLLHKTKSKTNTKVSPCDPGFSGSKTSPLLKLTLSQV